MQQRESTVRVAIIGTGNVGSVMAPGLKGTGRNRALATGEGPLGA